MPLTEAAPDALARTYATSLFELAQSRGGQATIEQVQGELEDVLELARNDRRFSEFLASRILPENEILQAIDGWLTADFEGGRHARRVDKIARFEGVAPGPAA